MVMMPYVSGVPDAIQSRNKVAMARKTHKNIKQLLVHEKDKRSTQETVGVVYSILCKDCDCVYMWQKWEEDLD